MEMSKLASVPSEAKGMHEPFETIQNLLDNPGKCPTKRL
jgi:hypothetical protein